MRRNCAKLVTLVGTFPVSSSLSSCCNVCSRCCFARRVPASSTSRNVHHVSCESVCKTASSFVNDTATHNMELASIGMWKRSFLLTSSLLHKPNKCSTFSGGGTVGLSYSPAGRNYCSNRNKNECDLTSASPPNSDSRNCNHLQQRNDDNDSSSKSKPQQNNNCSVYDNTQTRWSSNSRNSNEYCSINIDNDHNNRFLSSLSAIGVGGRLAKSCGSSNSNNASTGSSTSSTSSSSSVSAPVFGMMTTAGSNFTPVRTVVTSQRLVEVTRDSIMEQPKLLSKEEREEFMSVYHQLVKELLEIPDMKDMEETNRWMSRVLQYNVPHGKRNRGLSTALAYKYLAPEELTEDNVRLSYVLGWCVEILQAFFLVSDDIMDESETRRGRPCWYKVDNLGLAAVNDALLLEASIYAILRKHFSDKKYYARVMEVMHDVTYKTIFGQSLDTRTGQDRRMETYTMDRYSSIVKYKTSYYSFYLPVALAMTMCELTDPILFQQMRKVTLEMGHFFQVQDDYLDCFGDVEVTGKIGTDIQDCKCSWLFVVAMEMCNAEQKRMLLDNYGKHNPEQIEAVKKLYRELGMEEVYHNYEEQTYNMICTHIQQMNDQLPKGLFYDMLHKIYKRSS